jgi:hypothetical protein
MFEKYGDIVSFSELRTMLRIGRNSAYKLLSSNQIQSRRMTDTGKFIIPKKSVIDFVNRTQTKTQ